ncbi:MAG: site-specific DNA-methyltransferase [Planctomycetaceae bacterium]|nr:site-specific DNA-methyltransferase [Planctomycetaceae bacterium]
MKDNFCPANRNRTMTLSDNEKQRYRKHLTVQLPKEINNTIICSDLFDILPKLPAAFCDLIVADPPYNITKEFNGKKFKGTNTAQYTGYLRTWLPEMKRLLKPTGSIYVCGDWRSAAAIQNVLEEHFIIQNRITWEREKGRGAKSNWKNNSEDIWFATVSKKFTFHVERVMMKRKVIAPYTDNTGKPKDWNETDGGRFRITYPSNLWTDISVPFWSMPENTPHPTQKPEKLLAKIILASSNEGDVVFDPFLGSGTTAVVAKKLGRQYTGVELNEEYCLIAEKRLELADKTAAIQGYSGGVFWERNTLAEQKNVKRPDMLRAAIQNSFL